MATAQLYDLEVAGDDLAFGPDDEPRFLADAAVVAQDLRHRLRASGLPPRLLGAGPVERARLLAAIAREAEEDARIRPGSAVAEEAPPGHVRLTARTMEGTTIEA